jgi:hypothetical protein
LIVTLVAGTVEYVGIDEGPPTSYALLWTVAWTFWVIYGMLVLARYRYIRSYDLVLSNGIMVRTGGYKAPLKQFEEELERVLTLWSPHFPRAASLLEEDRIWVRFEAEVLKPKPFSRANPLTFAGLTVVGGEGVRLTYFGDPNRPLRDTAFVHELGHIILGRATRKWVNDDHHVFMKERNLP